MQKAKFNISKKKLLVASIVLIVLAIFLWWLSGFVKNGGFSSKADTYGQISNSATATYDLDGQTYTVQSNLVTVAISDSAVALNLKAELYGKTDFSKTFSLMVADSASGAIVYQNSNLMLSSTGMAQVPDAPLIEGKNYQFKITVKNYLTKSLNAQYSQNTTVDLGSLNPGDLNSDNTVNGADSAVLLSKWFTNDSTVDLNGDQIINAQDFALLAGNWQKQGD